MGIPWPGQSNPAPCLVAPFRVPASPRAWHSAVHPAELLSATGPATDCLTTTALLAHGCSVPHFARMTSPASAAPPVVMVKDFPPDPGGESDVAIERPPANQGAGDHGGTVHSEESVAAVQQALGGATVL